MTTTTKRDGDDVLEAPHLAPWICFRVPSATQWRLPRRQAVKQPSPRPERYICNIYQLSLDSIISHLWYTNCKNNHQIPVSCAVDGVWRAVVDGWAVDGSFVHCQRLGECPQNKPHYIRTNAHTTVIHGKEYSLLIIVILYHKLDCPSAKCRPLTTDYRNIIAHT